jgi:fumarate hydratase class II
MSSNTVAAQDNLKKVRKETDCLGPVNVPADKHWGAQTQRSFEHFSIGHDLIPREMIAAYSTLKRAAANANYAGRRFGDLQHRLIVQVASLTWRCTPVRAGPGK